jgi:hypothetical protein
MKSTWIAKYEENEIRIENNWFKGEKLFVNNKLQDDKLSILALSSNLTGHLKNNNGERLKIKVNISGFFSVGCRLFVDNKRLELTQIV